MSKIEEKDLYIYIEDNDDFVDYNNEKALFKTKFASDFHHNGEIVEVIGLLKGKDVFNDRYIVRFNDGTIDNNIMGIELNFDYEREEERKKTPKDKERDR